MLVLEVVLGVVLQGPQEQGLQQPLLQMQPPLPQQQQLLPCLLLAWVRPWALPQPLCPPWLSRWAWWLLVAEVVLVVMAAVEVLLLQQVPMLLPVTAWQVVPVPAAVADVWAHVSAVVAVGGVTACGWWHAVVVGCRSGWGLCLGQLMVRPGCHPQTCHPHLVWVPAGIGWSQQHGRAGMHRGATCVWGVAGGSLC